MTIPFKPFDDDDRPEPDDLEGNDPDVTGPADAGAPDAPTSTGAATAAAAATGPGASKPTPAATQPKTGKAVKGSLAEGDESALGTAATLSKAEAAGRATKGAGEPRKSSSSSGGGRRRRPAIGLAGVIAIVLLLAAIPLLRSTFQRTPRDRVGISYGGGPIEGVHFQKIVQPGSGLFLNGLFDSLFLYPSDQLNYILADTPGTDGKEGTDDAVVAPTSDRVTVSYQVAVYYKLNTDKLREFHEELGLRYEAYTDSGWDRLVRDTLRQQIESALQEETRRHPVADLYGDAELLVEIQNGIQATLSERLDAALGDRYFCGPTFSTGGECGDPTFIIKRTDIPKSVADAFESNRTSDVLIATKENEVLQREQEARGIAALSAALQEAGPAYVLLKAIESGKINFWVLPDDGSVNLTAPGATTAPATE